MRNTFNTREWYIPKNAELVRPDENLDAEFYYGADKITAMAFLGQAVKPTWNYIFKPEEERDRSVAETLESYRAVLAHRKARNEERKAKGRGLELGDIVYTSWGYDMTHVEFFEVTKLIGKTMVEIREVYGGAKYDKGGNGFTGSTAPMPGEFVEDEEPKRRVAKDGAIKIDDVRTAWKLGYETVETIRVYEPKYFNKLD